MKRRALISLGATSLAAGCTAVRGETPLASDEELDDRSAVLRFRDGDEEILQVGLQKKHISAEPSDYYPFRVTTWQRKGVRLSSLRLAFRSPPYASGFSPAGIHLEEGSHAEYATLSRVGDDPSTTVLDLPDIADIGDGSVVLQLLLAGDRHQNPQELRMNVDAMLSSDGVLGPDYSATGAVTVAFP